MTTTPPRHTSRFECDPMTPEEFDAALAALDIKRLAFSRLVGVDPRSVRKWFTGASYIPPWVPIFLATLDAPTALGRARSEANRRIRFDHEHPELGEFPYRTAEIVEDRRKK